MRPYDVRHDDPHPLARAAATRSAREQDPRTRAHARALTIAERPSTGFQLATALVKETSEQPGAFRPERIFAAVASHEVAYVVVGGIALIAHGVVRATADVALIPSPEPANLKRLADAIRSLGGVPHREPETAVTAELLARDANMRFDTDAGQVDLLCAAQYRRLYPDLDARAIEAEVEGALVRVASRNDLIRLKAGSGRDRDLLDIGDLLALDE